MNPSRLLVNILKYFLFWFWIYQEFDFSCLPDILGIQYCTVYTDLLRIFSVYEQIHSTYSEDRKWFTLCTYLANTHSKIPLEDWLHSAYSPCRFRLFSVREHIHYMYSQHMYRFILHIWGVCLNDFEYLNIIIFFTTLKNCSYLCNKTLDQKWKKVLALSSLTKKKFFCIF
jgi:hypothetical protein